MAEMKTLNGYEVVDAKARKDIKELKTNTDSYFLDFSKATTSPTIATDRIVDFANHLAVRSAAKDYDACAYMKDTHDNIYYPALIQYYWNNGYLVINLMKCSGNLNTMSTADTSWDVIQMTGNIELGWTYVIVNSDSVAFASKDYVSESIYDSKDSYYIDIRAIPVGEENEIPASTISTELVEFADRYTEGRNVCLHVLLPSLEGSGYKPVNIFYLIDRISITPADLDSTYFINDDARNYIRTIIHKVSGEWMTYREVIGKATIARKEYVDEQINALIARIEALETANSEG